VYTKQPDSCTSFSNKSNNFDQSAISFELIDKCIRDLKLGKASGPDELMAEHLKYAHPILIYHLCILFRAISVHSPLIVPLVKDKTGDINSVDNYRGITLTPVVAKAFECVLLSNCEEFLATDNLQFGFKRFVGCLQAVLTLRSVMDYFISRGSGVYAAAQAFDTVCHAKLFQCLVDNGVPGWIVLVTENWYSKLCVAVRWIDAISGF